MLGSTLESKFLKQQEFLLARIHKQMMGILDEWWPLTLDVNFRREQVFLIMFELEFYQLCRKFKITRKELLERWE